MGHGSCPPAIPQRRCIYGDTVPGDSYMVWLATGHITLIFHLRDSQCSLRVSFGAKRSRFFFTGKYGTKSGSSSRPFFPCVRDKRSLPFITLIHEPPPAGSRLAMSSTSLSGISIGPLPIAVAPHEANESANTGHPGAVSSTLPDLFSRSGPPPVVVGYPT